MNPAGTASGAALLSWLASSFPGSCDGGIWFSTLIASRRTESAKCRYEFSTSETGTRNCLFSKPQKRRDAVFDFNGQEQFVILAIKVENSLRPERRRDLSHSRTTDPSDKWLLRQLAPLDVSRHLAAIHPYLAGNTQAVKSKAP